MGVDALSYKTSASMDPAPVLLRASTVGPTSLFAAAEELDIPMNGCDSLFIFVHAELDVLSTVTEFGFEPRVSGPDNVSMYQLSFLDSQAAAGGIQLDDVVRKQYIMPIAASPAVNRRVFRVSMVVPAVNMLFWSDAAGHADDVVEVYIQRVFERSLVT